MKKIAFIGAGSFGFTRTLVRDILTFPAFRDCHIALMDIDGKRLEYIERAVNRIVSAGNHPAKVTATMDRAEALEGADGVLATILAGGVQVWRHDVEIPMKYGVDINVGDTRGPGNEHPQYVGLLLRKFQSSRLPCEMYQGLLNL